MSVEKVSLTSLRCLLFFYFGGAGCLIPFLSLHAEATGLGLEKSRLISFVAPLVATLGPVIFGSLVDYLTGKKRSSKSDSRSDKNTWVRTLLSLTVLLSAIFYCLLLAVPTVERLTPRQPSVSFVCNDYGASLVQEKCNELGCHEFPARKTGLVRLRSCRFNCDYPSHYGYIENPSVDARADRTTTTTTTTAGPTQRIRPEVDFFNSDDFFGTEKYEEDDYSDFGSGEEADFNWDRRNKKRHVREDSGLLLEEPPHICYNNVLPSQRKDKNLRMCFVYTATGSVFKMNVTLKPVHEDDQHCSYPLDGNFSCRIPPSMEKSDESCKVVCEIEDAYVPGSVLLQSQCRDVNGDIDYTFWLYLTFRSLGDLFFVSSVALAIGGTLVAAREQIGREFVLPSASFCFFSVGVGYLHSGSLSPLELENIPNFFLGIVGFGLLSMLALFVLIFSANMPIGPPDWWWTPRGNCHHKKEFFAVLFILTLLGALWGPIYFQAPWHITDRTDIELLVGAAAAIGALLSVPFVWRGKRIIHYCGYSNVFIASFTFHILRYTGSFFLDRPWMIVCIGCFEVFTLCLMLFSGVLYIRHLVPRYLTFTSQSLGVAAHFCLGNGLGCLMASLLSPTEEDVEIALNQMRNSTVTEDDPSEEGSLYNLVYCVGAITAAVLATVYFFVYHCCLKKRCFAPSDNKDKTNSLVQDNSGNGMYTPLRVYHNGRQSRQESGS